MLKLFWICLLATVVLSVSQKSFKAEVDAVLANPEAAPTSWSIEVTPPSFWFTDRLLSSTRTCRASRVCCTRQTQSSRWSQRPTQKVRTLIEKLPHKIVLTTFSAYYTLPSNFQAVTSFLGRVDSNKHLPQLTVRTGGDPALVYSISTSKSS